MFRRSLIKLPIIFLKDIYREDLSPVNRSILNGVRSYDGLFSRASSANSLPTTGASLKPCPAGIKIKFVKNLQIHEFENQLESSSRISPAL